MWKFFHGCSNTKDVGIIFFNFNNRSIMSIIWNHTYCLDNTILSIKNCHEKRYDFFCIKLNNRVDCISTPHKVFHNHNDLKWGLNIKGDVLCTWWEWNIFKKSRKGLITFITSCWIFQPKSWNTTSNWSNVSLQSTKRICYSFHSHNQINCCSQNIK